MTSPESTPWTMEDQTPKDPQPYFSVNQERASEYLEFIDNYPRSKQICLCGHTVTSHNFSPTIGYVCKPNTQFCPCDSPSPVYYARNASHFKRSTHGPGMRHALTQGIVALTSSGSRGEWLIELRCMVPDCLNLEIVPAPLNQDRRVTASASSTNVLICRSHAIEFGGDLIR
jgi:hypothetical protein